MDWRLCLSISSGCALAALLAVSLFVFCSFGVAQSFCRIPVCWFVHVCWQIMIPLQDTSVWQAGPKLLLQQAQSARSKAKIFEAFGASYTSTRMHVHTCVVVLAGVRSGQWVVFHLMQQIHCTETLSRRLPVFTRCGFQCSWCITSWKVFRLESVRESDHLHMPLPDFYAVSHVTFWLSRRSVLP